MHILRREGADWASPPRTKVQAGESSDEKVSSNSLPTFHLKVGSNSRSEMHLSIQDGRCDHRAWIGLMIGGLRSHTTLTRQRLCVPLNTPSPASRAAGVSGVLMNAGFLLAANSAPAVK